jgi:hypothetical protein
LPLAHLIDSPVVHPGRLDLNRACSSHDLARLGVTVANHQPPAAVVEIPGKRGHIRVDLNLQRGGQHAPGALPDDLVQTRTQLRAGPFVSYYSQHWRSFLAGVATPTFT